MEQRETDYDNTATTTRQAKSTRRRLLHAPLGLDQRFHATRHVLVGQAMVAMIHPLTRCQRLQSIMGENLDASLTSVSARHRKTGAPVGIKITPAEPMIEGDYNAYFYAISQSMLGV